MIDEELSGGLRAYSEAFYQYHYDATRRRGEAVLSAKERFLAAVGSDRGQELWAIIRALQAEADRVPGGPITNYIGASCLDSYPSRGRPQRNGRNHLPFDTGSPVGRSSYCDDVMVNNPLEDNIRG